eukprot:CAMPEP_0119470124 /NCGR_PEP_ID=MMETSP1344-20130328/3159_1 /TAXON_ID=236787 /ORGANISM="Florenciella parvula, Strain CCMP2471" /LENGTH=119 /DNA_ID=CAMNT_0007502761 /DNA_START=223 /DNA_END=582 /DNA_ORIENTATION=+
MYSSFACVAAIFRSFFDPETLGLKLSVLALPLLSALLLLLNAPNPPPPPPSRANPCVEDPVLLILRPSTGGAVSLCARIERGDRGDRGEVEDDRPPRGGGGTSLPPASPSAAAAKSFFP